MKPRRVLISGASIAGPALAYWLSRYGMEPTIVEKTPQLRPGGQAIDVRGAALQVVERMGLLPLVAEKRTTIAGMSMLDADGHEIYRSEDRTFTAGRHDSGDIEILRDDMSLILTEATAHCEYRFDDRVSELHDDGDRTSVQLASGETRDFDVVIGADGMNSGIRRLAFGTDDRFVHPLGVTIAIFTIENFLDLRDWQVAVSGTNSRVLFLPARANRELRVFAGFETGPDPQRLDPAGQRAMVRDRCGELGWQVPQALDAMEDASAFYYGDMAQVRMASWSAGRVGLVGDAAYCPSPMSGQGTSLAIVGAYVLAAELARDLDTAAALARYEARMRSFVDANQALVHIDRDDSDAMDAALDIAKNAIDLDGMA